MVPQILQLTIATWEMMLRPAPDEKEDNITNELCRALRKNRTVRGLMFTIDTQFVELDPMPGEPIGRLDIIFRPPIPTEEIYFCLEGKRLNALNAGRVRAYASEYVKLGMLRFISGQYSRGVRHGGMIGYVLDGNIARARTNIAANLRRHCGILCMTPPGRLLPSTVLVREDRARETHHHRRHERRRFLIHHLFVA
jgi:hypothetical protein